jgi:hypothetical protein
VVLADLSPQGPEGAIRRWEAAEQRLYPALMAWPEGYERSIALARAVADELGCVRTTESLADAYAQGVNITAAAARRHMLPTDGIDLELVAGAGFCLRYREIVTETQREEVARIVGEARARGQEWVVIHEARPWQQRPFPPWRRVEMHLPEGTGLHEWVEESLEGAGVEFGVEIVPLDPKTGRWLADHPIGDRRMFSDYEAWREEVDRLKAGAFKSVDSARGRDG